MELRHLRYFIAVAEAENVSRASERLHISQPAVSRQIRDLEDELGVELLRRTAKSVQLTEAGRFFLVEARSVVQRTEEAVKQTRALAGGERGVIHVGYAPSLTLEILPRTLRAFQQAYPKVRVSLHDLSTEEMLDRLRDGRLHVALIVDLPASRRRGLSFAELARYATCALVPPRHPLARKRSVSLTELAGEPLVGYSQSDYPEYHDFLTKVFARTKLAPRVTEEHDGVASLTAAVESGRGLAIAPAVLRCMVGERLKLIPLKPAIAPTVVGAAWKADTISPSAAKFLGMAGVPELA